MPAEILLADDDQTIAKLLGDHLERQGHNVIAVYDGFELSQQAAAHRPHLIIADIKMPGAYGSSAYQVLQRDEKTRGIPVIFISAHTRDEVAKILPKDPQTRFLHKPLDFKKLDAYVAELLPLGGFKP